MANIPGTPGNDVLNGTNLADTIAGNGGIDQIDGKGGDDVASGDLAEFVLNLSPPGVDAHESVTFGYDFGMMSNELKFNDTVNGGDGNDTLYGDASNVAWRLSAGSVVATDPAGAGSQVFFLEMHQLLGSNVVSGGSGDDRLYGNANTLYGDVHSGTAEATGAGVQANSYALAYEIRVIQSGPNTISGGNGNDLIVGNYSIAPGADAPAAASSGAATASDGGVAGSRADTDTIIDTGTGSNTLDGGNGNDTIYGNREVLAGATAFAGEATAARDFAIADSVANARFSSWEQGSDVISGGNGEDLIVGDVGAMVMRSVSSDASATDNNAFAQSISQVSSATVFNGNDLIHGDKGNDRIYGDSITTSVHAESGDATVSNAPFVRSIAQVSESRFWQGNDSLFGDEGNDIIFGDGESYTLSVSQGAASGDGAFSRALVIDVGANEGDDLINGGNGNDTIMGDTLEYELLTPFVFTGVTQRNGVDYVVIGDSANNSIVWGNDSLTGGKGADNFVFTLFQVDAETLGTQGHDVITDLERKVDVLTFGNVADVDGNSVVDVADLELVTTLSHAGGDTVINFNGSGSLTLQGVNIASLDDLNVQVLGTAMVV